MPKIKTHLWYDQQAEEAANFYTSLFEDSRVTDVITYENAGPEGQTVKIVTFELMGQEYIALDGGPEFRFNESFSLYVECDSAEEVDHYWNKLIEGGGEESYCGWLKDRFGMSWQVVPRILDELLQDPDPAKADRVMQAMLKMRKIEVQGLLDAANAA
ncbi:VOC family protein [Streptomonospora nanhaiensis]|uniref:VOC family protein n=1 Tax=Streptomonospora nanhaiensis TaxID=1323731 RepID=UPI001C99DF98|nr:VOC family protein [Streptomonospora nanhaiensis]MBX9387107.1 VOC family protein [Streptomonospora nanhaiensis]